MSNNNNSGIFGGSNNNNSNGANKSKERQEEMQILTRFKDVVTNKLEQMSAEIEDHPNPTVYKMGEHEKKILLQMQGMGLAEGMAAGVATFVLLRRGPIWIGKYIRNRRGGGGSTTGSSSSSMNKGKNNNPFHNASQGQNSSTMMSSNLGGGGGYQLSNPFAGNSAASTNPNFPRSRNPIVRGIWFLVDATISLMMAANVSVKYTDLKRIRNDLVELPLAEGKSLVSDAFCQVLTQELQQIQQENSPAYQRLVSQYQKKQVGQEESSQFYGNDSSSSSSSDTKGISPLALYMEGVTLFSQNCERRAFRQRELFQEQGGADTAAAAAAQFPNEFEQDEHNNSNSVSNKSFHNDDFESIPIPPPGVAKDGPRLVRNYVSTDSGMEDEEKEEYTVVYGNSDSNESAHSSFSSSSSSSDSDGSDYWRGS